MADLSYHSMAVCASRDKTYHAGGYDQYLAGYNWYCSCKAFQFSKGEEKSCKHLRELLKSMCDYSEQFDGPPKQEGVCPKCGGDIKYVMTGV